MMASPSLIPARWVCLRDSGPEEQPCTLEYFRNSRPFQDIIMAWAMVIMSALVWDLQPLLFPTKFVT